MHGEDSEAKERQVNHKVLVHAYAIITSVTSKSERRHSAANKGSVERGMGCEDQTNRYRCSEGQLVNTHFFAILTLGAVVK